MAFWCILNSSHSFDLRRLGRSAVGFPRSIKEERKIPSSSDVMVNNLQFWGLRNLKLHQITWNIPVVWSIWGHHGFTLHPKKEQSLKMVRVVGPFLLEVASPDFKIQKMMEKVHRSKKNGNLPTWSLTLRGSSKERITSQPSFFRGEPLNFGGVPILNKTPNFKHSRRDILDGPIHSTASWIYGIFVEFCEEARNQHFGWFSVLILWADFFSILLDQNFCWICSIDFLGGSIFWGQEIAF